VGESGQAANNDDRKSTLSLVSARSFDGYPDTMRGLIAMKYAAPLVLCLAACTNHLPLVGAPCPCAAGTVCEKATQRCVAVTVAGADGAVATNDSGASSDVPDLVPPSPPSPYPDPPAEPDGGWLTEDGPEDFDGGPAPERPPECDSLGFHSKESFEAGFIVPRCGAAGCHQAVFPPRHLDFVDMFRMQLVDQKSIVLCKDDYYLNRKNPKLSFMLAKVISQTEDVSCPSGGAANAGGTRMPNSMPAVAGPRLNDAEIACYIWWIEEMAR
jgi:hypothetical protein